MNKHIKTFALVFCMILIVLFYTRQNNTGKTASSNYYIGYFSQVPPNFEELLQQDYGVSPYHTNFDEVKISIEKTVREKYYIVYSWVTGDQSYFAITSIIEDTNKESLNKDDFNNMYIKDDRGNTYFPLPYFSLIDYPPDQPLGWKQILYVKFYPLDDGVKTVDVYITYKGVQKVIEGVEVD
ncbi:hypothetical protein GC105_08925 [Alkalibaculum sp. M08DMB]|uniref:Uncharacterized protein n=1 Tax=Alkalibaculum sporogenes TaxID=2655001 RepID=A0A6A7K942_9FIRM|nr:hypothetical protein [Alkalibaculum sporogenes]MPW25912.1 hypothetical protein [Alkalibaculum sporogenes]